MANENRLISGVIVGGDADKAPYHVCPHCGEDLTNGIEGFAALKFSGVPAATDLSFKSRQVDAAQFTSMQGTVVDCPKCHKHLQMTGIYGQLWLYHNVTQRAINMLKQLGNAGYMPPELYAEYTQVTSFDIYDKQTVYVPVDMNGVGFGSFKTYDEAFAEMSRLGLADVKVDTTYAQAVQPNIKKAGDPNEGIEDDEEGED